MRSANVSRLFAVVAVLALGGCGMPVAVQIVSLLADGASLIATEKSISDHGLSALTDQDCALWRGFQGEAICQDDETAPVVLAERKVANPAESAIESAIDASDFEDEFDSRQVDAAPPVPVKSWIVAVETVETLAAPAVSKAITPVVAKTSPSRPAYASQSGGYYYVIASYIRPNDAERFAGNHQSLTPVVLSGTAKGRQVYRVAVGPLPKDRRPTVRAKIVDAGIRDAWGLRLSEPRVITELAAIAG